MITTKRIIASLLAFSLTALSGCGTSAGLPSIDLPAETSDQPMHEDSTISAVTYKDPDDALNDFSVRLFKSCSAEQPNENSLISPLSVYTALAMVGSGAKGSTLAEMENTLGTDLSGNTAFPIASSDKDILHIANSMFVIERSDITINPEFKSTLQNKFAAEIFNEPCDPETVNIINSWVSDNTSGMITNALTPGAINPDTISLILNATSFEGKWTNEYISGTVYGEDFTSIDGSVSHPDFLHSTENIYIESENAIGLIKPYKSDGDNEYSFVAILPNEDIDINTYISNLTVDSINELIDSQTETPITARIPKFTFDNTYHLKKTLSGMGMPSLFGGGDLSGIASGSDLSVNDVVHKTHIELDESGTKAAAVTSIDIIKNEIVAAPPIPKEVFLDRPFVFMIYNSTLRRPIFIGKICTISDK